MADKSAKKADPEGEVSMEEILQSIRKIIAEEGDDPKAAAAKPEPSAGAPAAVHGSDVLELTDMVRDDGTVVNIKTMEEAAKAPPAAPPAPMAADPSDVLTQIDAAIAHPQPQAHMEAPAPEPVVAAAPEPKMPEGQLLSDEAVNTAAAAIKKIPKEKPKKASAGTPSAVFRSGVTVEDLVIEALKPMLKDWLDSNLPGMVERIVEKEIKKITSDN